MVNSQYLTLDSQFHQVETAGDVACCSCLQEECDADGKGDHGDGDLSALDPAGEEQARDGGGYHTRLPTPADKDDLSCPGDHLQRDAGATVEQDEGQPYVEQELSATPVQGVRDEPEHGRLDKGIRSDQHDHLGERYGRVYELETSPALSMRPKSRRMWSICSNL